MKTHSSFYVFALSVLFSCASSKQTSFTEKSDISVEPVPASSEVFVKRSIVMPDQWDRPDTVIVIGTRPGLKYDIEEISLKAGARVQLTFSNKDEMPHNLLIVNPGKGNEIGVEAIKLGVNGLNMDYVPQSPDVLFHTRLLQSGASDTIYFETPKTPGEYVYVCTYPGHYVSMKGVIKIT